jgi:hypothetical protein
MANSSYTLDAALLAATLTGNSYTGNATVYCALYSVLPTANTSGTELTGNGYSRQTVAFSVANNVATSTGNVTFSATGNAWTAVGAGILDAATAGNLLYFGSLDSSKTVVPTANLTLTTGNVTITLGP